jgi:hypothetical protein
MRSHGLCVFDRPATLQIRSNPRGGMIAERRHAPRFGDRRLPSFRRARAHCAGQILRKPCDGPRRRLHPTGRTLADRDCCQSGQRQSHSQGAGLDVGCSEDFRSASCTSSTWRIFRLLRSSICGAALDIGRRVVGAPPRSLVILGQSIRSASPIARAISSSGRGTIAAGPSG